MDPQEITEELGHPAARNLLDSATLLRSKMKLRQQHARERLGAGTTGVDDARKLRLAVM